MSSSAKMPLRKPEFRLEKMDNEILLFNPTTSNVLYLNESASVIWQLCDGQHSVEEMIKLLADVYPEAADAMRQDVQETLDLFINNGAVLLV
jgi:hypothetical protein